MDLSSFLLAIMLCFFQHRFALLAWVLLGLVITTSNIACSCNPTLTAEEEAEKKKKEEEEEEKKKKGKKEKPKPDFEQKEIRTVPTEVTGKTARNGVKPGHPLTLGTTIVANNFDAQGELQVAVTDDIGEPLDIDHTNYFIRSRRPASLPKGQPKFFESIIYVPRRLLPEDNALVAPGVVKSTKLQSVLTSVGGGTLKEELESVSIMEDYQYYLIVLASNPSSYSYMRVMDTVAPRYAGDINESDSGLMPYYRFTAPNVSKSVPLPSTALTWTTVAVIFWDDIDPILFSTEQQQALLDWLHWGGQLVVSGPRSLDRLRGSFLEPYLPALGGDSLPLTTESFAAMNDTWGVFATEIPKKKTKPAETTEVFPGTQIPLPRNVQPMPPEPKSEEEDEEPQDDAQLFPRNDPSFLVQILPNKPVLGTKLTLQANGSFVPGCGELVAERWAGRGRIVTTAFPLTDSRLYNWRNFDNFLNGAVLRRPARKWKKGDFDNLQIGWDGRFKDAVKDPRFISNLRFFSRDIGSLPDPQRQTTLPPITTTTDDSQLIYNAASRTYTKKPFKPTERDEENWHLAGFEVQPESGVAGWNDFSGAADAAKRALKDAAKVKIPKADFVFKMVGVYLLVLVPLNWLVFRSIGRVEWAWFAAPVIAVAAAGVVIRMAQLDIGFVRSRTDIGIVELQGGFDRAHVTRYTALYTSLSTGYDLAFEDPSALAMPLAEYSTYKRDINRDSALQITFQRDKAATMQGFQVDSSSTSWTHAEQMLTVGKIELLGDAAVGYKLQNGTELKLKDIGVIRRQKDAYQVAWVGELLPQTTADLTFADTNEPTVNNWETSQVMTSRQSDDNEVRLRRLADLAVQQLRFMDGEVRLIGWTDDELPGLQIKPTSSQYTKRSLVLAHLFRPSLGKPERDANVQADVDRKYGKTKLDERDFPSRNEEPPPATEPDTTPDMSPDTAPDLPELK